MLEQNKLEPRELNLKTLVPLIENCSLEQDEILSDKWSKLISSILTSPDDGLEPKLVKTLSNLSSIEAQVLDKSHEIYYSERRRKFLENEEYFSRRKMTEQDIKRDQVFIGFERIRELFKFDEEFTKICINNLETLGLVRYKEPEIELDKGFSEGTINEIEEGGTVDLDLDISVNYYQSNDFCITYYGFYFIRKCQGIVD